jgi:anaerobic selenocysteine-containing dehydrogenase
MSNTIIKKSICDICTPASHCGLDVHVKDGRIEKVTGAKDFPSRGGLCMKGAANRDYVYRSDRIRTPMKKHLASMCCDVLQLHLS